MKRRTLLAFIAGCALIVVGCGDSSTRKGRELLQEGVRESDKFIQEALFTQAIEADPSLASAFAARAKVRFESMRYEEALVDMDQAIDLEPHNQKFYHARAHIKQSLEDASAEADRRRGEMLEMRAQAFPELGHPAITHWLTWLLSCIGPILFILVVMFAVPQFLGHDSWRQTIILNVVCVIITFITWAGAYPAAPGLPGQILISVFVLGIFVLAALEIAAAWRARPLGPSGTHWVCPQCANENNPAHLTCWKCGTKQNGSQRL